MASRRFAVALVAAAACTGSVQAASLTQSATKFRLCAVDKNDVDLVAFSDATQAFCALLKKFGYFTFGSIQQVSACLVKVENGRLAQSMESESKGRRGKKRKSMRSMKALLAAEVEQGKHKKGGVLADPSAAMGLLWVRRGLMFWARLFELEAKRLSESGFEWGAAGTLLEQSKRAYDLEIAKFHGWIARNGFMVSLRSAPDWEVLCERAGMPMKCKELAEELSTWSREIEALARRMRAMHVKNDLEDARRCM